MAEHVELRWTKSSLSGAEACVEWAITDDERLVCLRNSRDPDGPVLRFTGAEWAVFVEGVKRGEADLRRL